jgi:hypothetical protein
MGRAGSALDNAGIESWHSTLEFELRSVQRFATRADAPSAVAAWIDDYNRHRRHSALQMSSPVDFEPGPQAPGAGSRPDMVPPSSPWSRPNPPGWAPGGLRPDLTPAAGAAVQQQSGTGRFKIKSHQLKSLRFQGIAGLRSSTGRHVRREVDGSASATRVFPGSWVSCVPRRGA